MPLLEMPDGVTLHWEEHGEGPTVLVAGFSYGYPDMVRGLVHELCADHRVLVPDLRGTGGSTRRGPYDMATDVADLTAVMERAGGAAVAVGIGDGILRAVEVAAARHDLIEAVVTSGYPSLFREEIRGTDALTASSSVLSALVKLLENDYRAAIRTIMESANPDVPESDLRERVDRVVAHCSHEAAVARMRNWIAAEVGEAARALGDRLWILAYPRNPWFPEELADHVPTLLPEAHLERVADGALSRPDLTARAVRRITRPVAA